MDIQRNAQWIFNEMQNIDNTPINCQDICLNNVATNIGISGNDFLCGYQNYALNVASGSVNNVNWSINSNVATLTSNSGSSTNLVPTNNSRAGAVTLSASLVGCNQNFPLASKNLFVNKPTTTLPNIKYRTLDRGKWYEFALKEFTGANTTKNNVCYGPATSTANIVFEGATSYRTIFSSGGQANGNVINPQFDAPAMEETFTLYAANGCGESSPKQYVFRSGNCRQSGSASQQYRISPNPTMGDIVISYAEESADNAINSIKIINVYDILDNVSIPKKTLPMLADVPLPYTIDISDLPNSHYVIELITPQNSEYHHILLQH